MLTSDELKSYVDANWPAIAPSPDDGKSEEEKKLEKLTSHVRYLLARRLTRESHIADARPYYPADWSATADRLMQALTVGWDESLPANQRANELVGGGVHCADQGDGIDGDGNGTGLAHVTGEILKEISTVDARTNDEPTLVAASADEFKRNTESKTEPDKRFHYRYQAAELAWEAAKLLPNNSDETARLLCSAGSWLKNRDPDAADRFYKALVRRCRKTAMARRRIRCVGFRSWRKMEICGARDLNPWI